MSIPDHFKVDGEKEIFSLLRANTFAQLVIKSE
jgi:predicted FMN-binding regulatory protein PaiB